MHSKHLARFGGKSHGHRARTLEEKKNKTQKTESFFPLNFNVYINLDNRERTRVKKKKKKKKRTPISLEEKHDENYVAAVRK